MPEFVCYYYLSLPSAYRVAVAQFIPRFIMSNDGTCGYGGDGNDDGVHDIDHFGLLLPRGSFSYNEFPQTEAAPPSHHEKITRSSG